MSSACVLSLCVPWAFLRVCPQSVSSDFLLRAFLALFGPRLHCVLSTCAACVLSLCPFWVAVALIGLVSSASDMRLCPQLVSSLGGYESCAHQVGQGEAVSGIAATGTRQVAAQLGRSAEVFPRRPAGHRHGGAEPSTARGEGDRANMGSRKDPGKSNGRLCQELGRHGLHMLRSLSQNQDILGT